MAVIFLFLTTKIGNMQRNRIKVKIKFLTLQKFILLLWGLYFLFLLPAKSQQLQWAKQLGMPGGVNISDMVTDHSGNVILTGGLGGIVDINPDSVGIKLLSSYQGGDDIYLAKFSAAGALMWAKGFGGSNRQIGGKLKLDSLDNIYMVGEFYSEIKFDSLAPNSYLSAIGNDDIYVAKFSSSGTFNWCKSLSNGFGQMDDGNLAVDKLGNVYVTASFSDSISYYIPPSFTKKYAASKGGYDIALAKYNSTGDILWVKRFGAASDDNAGSVSIDPLGNILLTGSFVKTVDFDPSNAIHNLVASQNQPSRFYAKYTPSGAFIWANMYLDIWSGYTNRFIWQDDNTGDFILAGAVDSYNSIDFDPGPAVVNLTQGSRFTYLAKYTINGSLLWLKNFEFPDTSNSGLFLSNFNCDQSKNIILTGTFIDTVDFDPDTSIFQQISRKGANVFVAKYDSAFNFIYERTFEGKARVQTQNYFTITATTTDATDNLFIGGYFQDTLDVNLGPVNQNLITLDSSRFEAMFAKYNSILLSTNNVPLQPTYGFHVKVYPNPAQGILFIQVNPSQGKLDASIYDNLGRKLYTSQFEQNRFSIDLGSLKNGRYYLKLSNSFYSEVAPIVVMH